MFAFEGVVLMEEISDFNVLFLTSHTANNKGEVQPAVCFTFYLHRIYVLHLTLCTTHNNAVFAAHSIESTAKLNSLVRHDVIQSLY